MAAGVFLDLVFRLRSVTPQRLSEWVDHHPRCAVGRYLAGCACFDAGRPATAVRHMMVAHHSEPAFESAALLVFAGLKTTSRRGPLLLATLLETWEEFQRPEFDRTRRERQLLDAFAESDSGIGAVPSLVRRLWRLPIRSLRSQIADAARQPTGFPATLLTSA